MNSQRPWLRARLVSALGHRLCNLLKNDRAARGRFGVFDLAVGAALTLAIGGAATHARAALSCNCPADFSGDGVVAADDLALLLGAWGTAAGDLNGDGVTNAADLAVLLGAWGTCAAPVNDLCSGASELGVIGDTLLFLCTDNAGTDGPPLPASSGCNVSGVDQIVKDVWYVFEAPSSPIGLSVSTCQSDFDTKVALYRVVGGNPCTFFPSLQLVACDDDAPDNCPAQPLASYFATGLIPNSEYYLRVGGYNGSGSAVVEVNAYQSGDLCADAEFTQIFGCPAALCTVSWIFDTTLATDEPFVTATSCGGDADTRDMWIAGSFSCANGTNPVPVTVTTCNSTTNFDTVLTVFDGTCDSLVEIACNDDSADAGCQIAGFNRKSKLTFNAVPDHKYLMRIAGYNGATGVALVELTTNCQ